jgi:gamma-glutamyltranspeptidase
MSVLESGGNAFDAAVATANPRGMQGYAAGR